MLSLEQLVAGLGVGPVREPFLVVVDLDLLDLEAVRPRVGHNLARPFEVVLDVTLATDERAHLLASGVPIWIVARDPLLGLERLDAGDEARARDADAHRLRVVAVHARHRMLDEKLSLFVLRLARLPERHARDLLEPLLHVALADEPVEGEVRGVAVQAGPRLLALGHAPGLLLVEERVVMAAPVAVVEREGVTREDALEPGIALELLLGWSGIAPPDTSPPVLRRRRQRRLQVRVVLEGPVLGPDLRIRGVLGHLDHPDEGLPGLLLALEDVREEREQEHGEARDPEQSQQTKEPASPHALSFFDSRASTGGAPAPRQSATRTASASGAVPGAGVTVQAIQRSPPVPAGLDDRVDQGFVTSQAIRADQITVVRCDLDRLLEVLQRERSRVTKPVLGLRHPLHDAGMRQMTLDAGRGVAMAALEPRVILLVHDVAIHT